MNERIRELVEQASYNIIETDGAPIISREFNKEKFAELIVRECVDLCELWNITPGSRLAKEIKDHFGVKE